MTSARMEALTDGVIAIIITIMVLELKVPRGNDLADAAASLPMLLVYCFSFVTVGLFWNNHHHLLQATNRIDGRVLWANLLLLFWLSLIPFVIRWLDASEFAAGPTAAYGVVLGMAAVGYLLTERAIIACNPDNALVARAIGRDLKGRMSLLVYAIAIPLAFVFQAGALAAYVGVLALWFIPDGRIERALADGGSGAEVTRT